MRKASLICSLFKSKRGQEADVASAPIKTIFLPNYWNIFYQLIFLIIALAK